ncbi:MAG TPA: hypothetical protein VGM10_07200 [Actinocrinis sp.]|jgi:hypothetical protein
MHTEPDKVPRRDPARKKYIVRCPACDGTGHVVREGSQVSVGCRLCWERGLVARIVAEIFERER